MNAIELLLPDGKPSGIHACGCCKRPTHDRREASRCCLCTTCGEKPPEPLRRECKPCRVDRWARETKARDERDRAIYEKAKKVALADYAGQMVYDEEIDEYLSIEEIEQRVAGGEAPDFVWGTTPNRLTFDARDIVESQLENGDHHEDAIDEIPEGAFGELAGALEAWCEEHGPTSYEVDHTTVVLLDDEPEEAP